MNKIKSLIASIALISILAIFSLSAYGAMTTISCSTYAVWNAQETQAYAKTDSYSPATPNYYINADITSNTGDHSYAYKHCTSGGSNSVSTSWVNVIYGGEDPLVSVNGGYWIP